MEAPQSSPGPKRVAWKPSAVLGESATALARARVLEGRKGKALRDGPMALNVAPGTKRRSLLAGTSLAEGASGYAKPWQASLSFKDGSAAVVQSATSRQREKRRLEKAGNAAAPEAGGRGNEAAAGQVLHSRAAGAATARPEVASLGESVASRVGSATAAAAKHATRPGLGMPMILAGVGCCAGFYLYSTMATAGQSKRA